MEENIVQQAVEEEITQSYIDYSMSVIVSRALPDVRDGMKPVQRRILYAMYDLKLFHNAKFKKSAAVIGEVLGKYHPHGDSSVYEALVRMAQPFSLRYPLVDGQGNFGNIDGDGAAAMRYTEARLTKIAEEMLQDIDQETVQWRDNYDSSRREPVFLPTKFPNHLCNGTMGIAVGMATNMAPHNLTEIIDATLYLLKNPEATVDNIMEYIKGPDFPTGGVIFDSENIKEVYKKGKGSITLRGKVHVEESKKGNNMITIYELPYQLNKATFVSKIGELINSKKLEGIQDITDESNKESIKISITLRSGVEPDIVLTKLYKLTDLQTNFNLNNIVLTEGGLQPRLQNIKDLLQEFVAFRRNIVYNRSLYQLNKAKDRLHILEGLQKAIDILDQVIETIRGSQTRPEAKEKLMNNFEFTDPQADYILMLRLQTLVGLEIQKIEDEISDKKSLIDYLTQILNEPEKLDEVVIEELTYMKNTYGDDRRTEVSNDYSIYQLDNSLKNIKRLEELQKEDIILRIGVDNTFKVLYQSRLNNIPEDTLKLEYTHNQNKIISISNKGEIVVEKLKELGSHNIKGKGVDISKEYNTKGDTVFIDSMTEDFDYLMFITNKNNIKKVKKDLITSMKKFPTTIMGLEENEEIIKVLKIKESQTVGVVSNKGHLLLFKEGNARPTGKTAGGVKATTLEDDENLVDIFKVNDEQFFFIYSDDSGKMISMEDLKLQKRGQKGIKVVKLKNGEELKGGMALEDGQIKAQLEGGEVKDIQENNLKLKTKNTGMDKIVAGKIHKIYEYEKNKDDYKDE